MLKKVNYKKKLINTVTSKNDYKFDVNKKDFIKTKIINK
jgi:hypothetical protein